MKPLLCRFCSSTLTVTFADLGLSPLSNAFLKAEHLEMAETFYPLHARVCGKCMLAQLPQMQTPENIFGDYAYFSSYSTSWLKHCEAYTETMIPRLGLGKDSLVVELASNDGYLLQYFKQRGVPVLGVEPAANVAKVAEEKGIPTSVRFFGVKTAEAMVKEGRSADLLIGNNVLAHVPDLNDFVEGMARVLKPAGTITLEFPHLLRLMQENQFDTIYHEHFSYLSLLTVEKVLAAHKLQVYDVEEHRTHGGSLRVFARHASDPGRSAAAGATPASGAPSAAVAKVKADEIAAGLDRLEAYAAFGEKVKQVKRTLLRFLVDAKEQGKSIAGYGAPAKGNSLLNYCGIRSDFIDYTVDLSPHKQGLFLPGTRIPIYAPAKIFETRPDYVIILPWNLKDEVMEQMKDIRSWGGKFVVPIPQVKIL